MFECEGFTEEMMHASGGNEYLMPPEHVAQVHIKDQFGADVWAYEKLVFYNQFGITEWYTRKCGLTQSETSDMLQSEEIQQVGAFFLRHKIALERFLFFYSQVRYIGEGFMKVESNKRIGPMQSMEEANAYQKRVFETLSKKRNMHFARIFPEEMDDSKLFFVERIVHQIQCVLFSLIRNKKIPFGFRIDARIKHRALTYPGYFIKDIFGIMEMNPLFYQGLLYNWLDEFCREFSTPLVWFQGHDMDEMDQEIKRGTLSVSKLGKRKSRKYRK